jgi:hypothetical protein
MVAAQHGTPPAKQSYSVPILRALSVLVGDERYRPWCFIMVGLILVGAPFKPAFGLSG